MLSSSQRFALQQMGIPIWQQRVEHAAKDKIDAIATEPVQSAEPSILVLNTTLQCLIAGEALNQAEGNLLLAMLRALNIHNANIADLRKQTQHDIALASSESTAIIFGVEIAELLLEQTVKEFGSYQHQSQSVIVIPTLQQMLDDTSNKAVAWRYLKPLRINS
jgi:DNA polymerase III psi subunit